MEAPELLKSEHVMYEYLNATTAGEHRTGDFPRKRTNDSISPE